MARNTLMTHALFGRSLTGAPILLGILVSVACLSSVVAVTQSDREREGLRGPVARVIAKSGPTITISTYDQRGNLVEVESRRTPPADQPELGESVEKVIYAYDDEGNRTSETIVDGDGNQYPSRLYVYDAAGNRLAEAAYHMCRTFSSLHIYTHDAQRHLQEDLLYQGRTLLKQVHSYDEGGRVAKSLTYRNGVLQSTTQYVYDRTGRITEQSISLPDETPSSKAMYEYDDKGNRISAEIMHPTRASLNSKEVFTYKYDAAGNWTRRVTRRLIIPVEEDGTPSAEPIEMTERSLTYR